MTVIKFLVDCMMRELHYCNVNIKINGQLIPSFSFSLNIDREIN